MSWVLILLVVIVAAVGAGLVASSRTHTRGRVDPFTIGEPWRQFVQGATRAGTRLHQTIESASDGPLKTRMESIADRLDEGLRETWEIARRGDRIDATIRRLDPTALRSKLDALEARAGRDSSSDVHAAATSLRSQLDSVRRLEVESTKTADRLRLTQTRLDELVSRASEVAIGAGDTDAYEHDVDDLVIELEALRQAVDETNRP